MKTFKKFSLLALAIVGLCSTTTFAQDVNLNDHTLFIRNSSTSKFGIGWKDFGASEFSIFSDNNIDFMESDNSTLRARYSLNNGTFYFNGKMGINNTAPTKNLEVSQNGTAGGMRLSYGSRYPALYTDFYYESGGSGLVINANANGSWARITFQTDRTKRVLINSSGMEVDGKIVAEEIEVKDVGADYVFAEDYNLRSLAEVEAFILENNHLPGIAPACETEQGINIGEFSEKLLEKIEELTLYMIQQNETIKAQEERIAQLEAGNQ